MGTMYVAANNSVHRGYFVGDVCTMVKAAWMFAENTPCDNYLLSLLRDDPWNYLWDGWVRAQRATVVWDENWPKGNRDHQYSQWDKRRAERNVHGHPFDVWRELAPRLETAPRHRIFHGKENGLGRRNIFEYYYFGQPDCPEPVRGSTWFGPGLFDLPNWYAMDFRDRKPKVFLAPHEKCQGNRVFTHAFWEQVALRLLDKEVEVVCNDNGSPFMAGCSHPLFQKTYPPANKMAETTVGCSLVLCGNTGTGWIAGATGTPLVAAECGMNLGEYSFEKCGLVSLRATVREPNPEHVAGVVLGVLGQIHG